MVGEEGGGGGGGRENSSQDFEKKKQRCLRYPRLKSSLSIYGRPKLGCIRERI